MLIPRSNAVGEVMTILVGTPAKRYHLHKGVLRCLGGYFRAAVRDKNGFREAATNTIVLDQESTDVFDRFTIFAYKGDFCSDGESEKEIGWKVLIDLFNFADRRIIPKMQNKVIQVFAIKIDWDPNVVMPPKYLRYLYKTTLDGSSLRSLVVDAYAWNLRVADDKLSVLERSSKRAFQRSWSMLADMDLTELPSTFLFEVLKEVTKKAAKLSQTRSFSSISAEYYVKELHDSAST